MIQISNWLIKTNPQSILQDNKIVDMITVTLRLSGFLTFDFFEFVDIFLLFSDVKTKIVQILPVETWIDFAEEFAKIVGGPSCMVTCVIMNIIMIIIVIIIMVMRFFKAHWTLLRCLLRHYQHHHHDYNHHHHHHGHEIGSIT